MKFLASNTNHILNKQSPCCPLNDASSKSHFPELVSHFPTFQYKKVGCESSFPALYYFQLAARREIVTNLNTSQTAFTLHLNCLSVVCVVWVGGTESFISVDGSLIHSLSSWCVMKLFSISASLFALQYIVKWIPHVVVDSIKEGCDLGPHSTPHYKQLTGLQPRASLLSQHFLQSEGRNAVPREQLGIWTWPQIAFPGNKHSPCSAAPTTWYPLFFSLRWESSKSEGGKNIAW